MAAYADDLLFFLAQSHVSILYLTKAFKLFGYISNMKINYTKSEALNLTLPSDPLAMACSLCLFKWVTSSITYLGIKLTGNLGDIYNINFPP